MTNKTKDEQDAIAAFLAKKTPTQCPPGSGMEIAERQEQTKRAWQEFIASTGSCMPRGSSGYAKKTAKAAYAQRAESRLVRGTGTKQIKEKHINVEKHK